MTFPKFKRNNVSKRSIHSREFKIKPKTAKNTIANKQAEHKEIGIFSIKNNETIDDIDKLAEIMDRSVIGKDQDKKDDENDEKEDSKDQNEENEENQEDKEQGQAKEEDDKQHDE